MEAGEVLCQYVSSTHVLAQVVQVAEAVDYLHTVAGFVHGDLKCVSAKKSSAYILVPDAFKANFLVSDSDDALLGDFGLSTVVEKSELDPATMTSIRDMHTARFAAPELLLGADSPAIKPRSKTRESDVYAFGMLVLEAITGQPPWSAQNNVSVVQKVCSAQIPPRPTLDGIILMSDAWWKMCQRCWSFEPGNRPPMNVILETLKVSIPPLALSTKP
ncbi:kinase-like protein [Auricularia subglabra TFB-10046 SS5]|nr:kinase-like protein [Auricularia subglabra TFB-10046 SS5]